MEEVRLDAQPHEHDRDAQDGLADEGQPLAPVIPAAIVRPHAEPAPEGRIDDDGAEEQRDEHVGQRDARGHEALHDERRGADGRPRQSSTPSNAAEHRRLGRRGGAHVNVLPHSQMTNAARDLNSAKRARGSSRRQGNVGALTFRGACVSDMSVMD